MDSAGADAFGGESGVSAGDVSACGGSATDRPAGPGGADARGDDSEALTRSLVDGVAEVERRLAATTDDADPMIAKACAHLLRAGGKRLRPTLVLLAAELGQGRSDAVLDAATVVELTHMASLYHDDVMDAAALRRGAPSAHARYGNAVAILTGDLLFARASTIVAGLGPQCVRIQAEAFARLCRGQIRETVGPPPGEDPIAHHLSVLRDKTASLIAAAAHLGALLAGCPAPVIAAAVEFGEKVGVAFQLADDLIDLTADPAVSGKTPGTDLREHIATLPALLLQAEACADREAGNSSEAVRLAAILDGDLSDPGALADAVAALAAHPVTAQARATATGWAEAAIADLAPLPPSPAKHALAAFAREATSRLA
ncbi:MAG: polyprenyl synthetase family protein [Bifidobacteriaceae bacterium]|nr:polyprenyl synthetase family protein [Bifidobacteriaceae bacterium]